MKKAALATAVCLALVTAIVDAPDASAHGVATCPTSRFVRLDNEQFYSYNITAGESITITGELRSLVNKELDITFVPIVDLDKVRAIVGVQQCGPSSISVADIDRMAASEWQLVYASYLIDSKSQINLGPGATAPFILEVKSASPGTFHLAVAYVIEDVIVHLGRAQTVQVQPTQPQLEECRELGISPDKCNDIAVFQTRELQHRDKMVAQEQQEQLDTAMNMIGIGAAIAGIMAFVMLRKKIMLPKCSKAMLAIIILLVSDSATMDEKIAYHEEMEQISTQAGDFTKAEHHRKMQEIYRTMKEAAMTKA